MRLSRQDLQIVLELQRNGRISNAQLAEKLGMSISSCLRKTRALEEAGVIAAYSAHIEPRALGYQLSAYILVNLDQRSETVTQQFFEAVRAESRIVECVALTGQHDLLLKVVARDIDDLADLTMGGILSFDSVKDIASCVVLKEVKSARDSLLEAAS